MLLACFGVGLRGRPECDLQAGENKIIPQLLVL